ncbi:MAG: class I SAM-dependent methyltransferase [Casimicrobiaceae bacterium]
MNLTEYRASAAEQERVKDLLRLLPGHGDSILDIGSRDGYISKLLVDRFDRVVALDLVEPAIDDPRIDCVAGDLTALQVADKAVECVLCAEVLEHIPPDKLERACAELSRVARSAIVIGVPFRQDIRLGRTTCGACGAANPPWGHVNSFDQDRLTRLFPTWRAREWSYIGETRERTNSISTALMQFAGNPYGTYSQEEHCIHCGSSIGESGVRNFVQKVATRIASQLTHVQQQYSAARPKWVHVVFARM